MQHPTDRITHTTAFVTPVVEHWLEREIALLLGVNEGSVLFNNTVNTFSYGYNVSRSNQYSMTSVTKAVVCAVLSVGCCI